MPTSLFTVTPPRLWHQCAAFALSLLAAASAWALPAQVQDQASELLLKNKAQDALNLIAPFEDEYGSQFAFALLAGMACADIGQIDRGIIYLQRALALQPGDAIARAELARAYVLSGESASADELLKSVRADAVPTSAQSSLAQLQRRAQPQNITAALTTAPTPGQEAIARDAENQRLANKPGYVQLSVATGHDGNLNSAPRDRTVFVPLFGGINLLTEQPRASWYLEPSVNAAYRAAINERWSWQVAGQLAHRSYTSEHQFDYSLAQLRTGPTLGLSPQWALQAEVEAQRQWADGKPSKDTQGALLVVRWAAAQTAVPVQGASAYVQRTKLDDLQADFRDARRQTMGVTAYGQGLGSFAPQVGWNLNVFSTRERIDDATAQDLAYTSTGFKVDLRQPIGAGHNLGLSVSLERRKHQAEDFLLLQQRRDMQRDITLFAEIQLKKDSLVLVPAVQLGRNQSNLASYDSQRTQVSLSLRSLY
jgi:outer membrane protein